jgi:transcriptional regulator with XRE-family HTH domain
MHGKEIKQLRKRLKLTQKRFAKLVGFSSYNWLSAVENNKVPVSKRLRVICREIRRNLKTEGNGYGQHKAVTKRNTA